MCEREREKERNKASFVLGSFTEDLLSTAAYRVPTLLIIMCSLIGYLHVHVYSMPCVCDMGAPDLKNGGKEQNPEKGEQAAGREGRGEWK